MYYNETVQEWMNAIPKKLHKGILPDIKYVGRAFIETDEAVLALMGVGAVFICRVDCRAMWLEDDMKHSLGFNIRSSILLHLENKGYVTNKDRAYPEREYRLTKTGKRKADALLDEEEEIPVSKQEKPEAKKEVNEVKANSAILDHAIGPFAGGYALQVIFSDLESLVRVAKGMGIDKPKLETIAPIVPTEKRVSLLDLPRERKELVASPDACASCGTELRSGGRQSKSGFRFCMDPGCQKEKYIFNRSGAK